MLEGADARDRRSMLRLSPNDCQHCGNDSRDPRYSWRNGITTIFGCCPKMLQEQHGADPNKTVQQRIDHSLFGGRVKPDQQAALLTLPR